MDREIPQIEGKTQRIHNHFELIRFAIKQFLYGEERIKTFKEMTKKL